MYSGPAIGLYSSPNPFTQTPAGTLKRADNVRFTAPGVIEPRRGFYDMGSFGDAASLADAIAFYASNILVAYDLTNVGLFTPARSFLDFSGDFEPVGANRMRFEGAARSCFFNTAAGLYVFDGSVLGESSMETGLTIAYDGGSGTHTAGEVITDTTTGADGVSETALSGATGAIYMRDATRTGTFANNNAMTGTPSFAGDVNGTPTVTLFAAADAGWLAGQYVTGVTSGATARINAAIDVGSYLALVLTGITGAFSDESVAVSAAPIEARTAGCPQGLNIAAENNSDDGWQTPDSAVAYRFVICAKDAFGRIIKGPPSGRVVVQNLIESEPTTGGMSRTANVVLVYTATPHYLDVGDVVVLTPGEANFAAGSKTVASTPTAYSFTYAEVGAAVSSVGDEFFEITRSNDLTLYLPVDDAGVPVTTSNFLQVYRSDETLTASDTPSDELYQCYESPFFTQNDIDFGYIQFTDTAPTATLDVPLYTNTNDGSGALSSRYQPPVSLDIAYWGNRMWFGNTAQKHSLLVSLIGVGSPDGIQVGDTFGLLTAGNSSLEMVTFTGVAVGAPPGQDVFTVFEDGDPGFNIQRTAQNLCQHINDYSFATAGIHPPCYAFYVSSEGGQPGQILLVARAFGDDHRFQAYCERPEAFAPQLPNPFPLPSSPPASHPIGIPSSNNAHPAGLSYSPLGIPDAVTPVGNLVVNSDNDAILRIFPLHYRLLVFKTDGIYTCTNVEPFSIQKLSAYVLLAPDSVAVLEDRVYALTDQGIITISDAGVVDISTPIEDILNALNAPTSIEDLSQRAFGVAYRSERQYLLWVIEKNDDGTFSDDNAQAFVFSTQSDGFTRYAFGARCAAVDPDLNSLVYASTDEDLLRQENKDLTDFDYYDDIFFVSVTGCSGSEVTVDDATGVQAGDIIQRSSARYLVESVSGNVLTVLGTPAFSNGSAAIFSAIECAVEFNKLTAGTPAELKFVQQASFLFRENGIHEPTASFTTEITTDPSEVPLEVLGWGEFPWGGQAWGSPTQQIQRIEPLPDPVAQCAQLSVGFTTRQALAKFEFLGIDIQSKKDATVNRG